MIFLTNDKAFSRGSWILLAGDLLILWIFSLVGRAEHEEGLALLSVAETAAPFFLGWVVSGLLLKGFQVNKYANWKGTLRWTLLLWFAGVTLGLLFRALWLQRGIPVSFAVITYLFNLILLLAWRSLFGWGLRRKRSTGAE